ncbi:hypothetical protein B0H13DRAFT_2125662 [Mycena leptocephala]|nr:hypothetical protein B0H13DRAFT_2125662 [Mycena leptocephala]
MPVLGALAAPGPFLSSLRSFLYSPYNAGTIWAVYRRQQLDRALVLQHILIPSSYLASHFATQMTHLPPRQSRHMQMQMEMHGNQIQLTHLSLPIRNARKLAPPLTVLVATRNPARPRLLPHHRPPPRTPPPPTPQVRMSPPVTMARARARRTLHPQPIPLRTRQLLAGPVRNRALHPMPKMRRLPMTTLPRRILLQRRRRLPRKTLAQSRDQRQIPASL